MVYALYIRSERFLSFRISILLVISFRKGECLLKISNLKGQQFFPTSVPFSKFIVYFYIQLLKLKLKKQNSLLQMFLKSI